MRSLVWKARNALTDALRFLTGWRPKAVALDEPD